MIEGKATGSSRVRKRVVEYENKPYGCMERTRQSHYGWPSAMLRDAGVKGGVICGT